MAKLTKDKVRSMMPSDLICVPCDTAAELDSVYMTAYQAIKEAGDGMRVKLSKSNLTMTVVMRSEPWL